MKLIMLQESEKQIFRGEIMESNKSITKVIAVSAPCDFSKIENSILLLEKNLTLGERSLNYLKMLKK